jgi:hypothetical protein
LQLQVRWSRSFALTVTLGGVLAVTARLAEAALPEMRIPLELASAGLAVQAFLLALQRAWPRDHQLKMDEDGFELRRGARLDAARWGSIGSIEPHKRRDRYDFPGIELKVRDSSGAEHVWIDIWDLYTTPRAELAVRLNSWRARYAVSAPTLPDRLANHVVSRDIRAMTYGALAVPGIILAFILLVIVARS